MENHEVFKDIRKRCGLTLQEMADRLGVSKGTIVNIEAGACRPFHLKAASMVSIYVAVERRDLSNLRPEDKLVLLAAMGALTGSQ